MDISVLKLGGSLLDLDDLLQRLAVVRAACVTGPVLMIVGGAEAADVVRRFDRLYQLGEVAGHWLAVRAMQFNAFVVAAAIADSAIVKAESECDAAWQANRLAIIDPLEWLTREEARGITIPHRWTFTSDSIAAHVAVRMKASRLIMLKSKLPEGGPRDANDADGVPMAAAQGLVDADFHDASRGVPSVAVINLRHASLASGRVDSGARLVLR